MEIVDHALHALSDEVLVPHSGWERGSNGAGGGEENCKPRHLEWETALTNTAGCLRYGRSPGGGREENVLVWWSRHSSHSLVLKQQKPPLMLWLPPANGCRARKAPPIRLTVPNYSVLFRSLRDVGIDCFSGILRGPAGVSRGARGH